MQLITKRFKVAVPIYKHFDVVKSVYTQNSNSLVSPYHMFVNNYYCKGDVVYSLVESTVRCLWGLSLGEHACSISDGKRILKNLETDEDFEIRTMMNGSYWGPSTSTGKGREPDSTASLEEWEEHGELVLKKINTIDSFIVCDLAYPPYWFIYEIPRMSVLFLYEAGILRWNCRGNKNGIIKNKISRNQFYKYFVQINGHNPFSLNWEGKSPNPFNLTDKDIEKNKEMLGYRSGVCSWIKIKEQDKKKKGREEENIIFESMLYKRSI